MAWLKSSLSKPITEDAEARKKPFCWRKPEGLWISPCRCAAVTCGVHKDFSNAASHHCQPSFGLMSGYSRSLAFIGGSSRLPPRFAAFIAGKTFSTPAAARP
jgi:hypothetical protein